MHAPDAMCFLSSTHSFTFQRTSARKLTVCSVKASILNTPIVFPLCFYVLANRGNAPPTVSQPGPGSKKGLRLVV
jgi:hypothetical protein